MKKKILLLTAFFMLAICAFSFTYDPNSWTTCITNGTGMNGEQIANNYFCNSFDGEYDGEETILSKCETSGYGDAGGCSGNSLAFFPTVY